MTRNQARILVAVSRWQRNRRPRRPHRLIYLMRILRADAATTALALKINGWYRDQVRSTENSRRKLITWWIPPNGRPANRRRRGRPSYSDLFTSD